MFELKLENYMELKTSIRLEMIGKFLLTVGGIFYANQLFNKTNNLSKLLGGVLLLVSIYFMLNRDFYLPFLGKCAIPPNVINKAAISNGDISVKLSGLPPKTQIVYWASLPSSEIINDPQLAYGDYKNSGTIETNENGDATVRIACPGNYSVGTLKKVLNKHLHYRYALVEYPGLYSRIYTAKVEC